MPRKTSEQLAQISDTLAAIDESVQTLGKQLVDAINHAAGAAVRAQQDTGRFHREVEDLRHQLADLRETAPVAAVSATPCAPTDCDKHHELLGRAAGITYAQLVCHRDHWAFLVREAGHGEHFHLPVDIDAEDDGTIEVDISGRTLIAVLDALWGTQQKHDTSATTRLLAFKTYERVDEALRLVGTGQDGGVVRIVIDDRQPSAPGERQSAPGHQAVTRGSPQGAEAEIAPEDPGDRDSD